MRLINYLWALLKTIFKINGTQINTDKELASYPTRRSGDFHRFFLMFLEVPLLIFLSTLLFACASSEKSAQQTEKKEPEIYVFDDVNKPDSLQVEIPIPAVSRPEKPNPDLKDSLTTSTLKFIVQVAAFTTQERAQAFVNENQSKIAYILNISLRDTDKFYVVRLHPFETREDAEKVRNSIWQIPSFKDAFIITLE